MTDARAKNGTDAKLEEQREQDEQAKKDAAAAEAKRELIAKQQASITPEEQREFNAFEDSRDMRRAALTVMDQKRFDAMELLNEMRYGATRAERQLAFGAMSTEQRKAYIGLTADVPTQQHIDEEFFAQITYEYVSNLPMSDAVYGECVARFKLLNPPEADAAAASASTGENGHLTRAQRQALHDEAEADKRARAGR